MAGKFIVGRKFTVELTARNAGVLDHILRLHSKNKKETVSSKVASDRINQCLDLLFGLLVGIRDLERFLGKSLTEMASRQEKKERKK